MALQKTSPQNVFLDRGNSLAIYIDGKTGVLMLKDSNGQIQPVSDYISGASGNFIQNQNTTYQDANFKIVGNGTIGPENTLFTTEQRLNINGYFNLSDEQENIFIGNSINQGILSANRNVSIGSAALQSTTDGNTNVAIGPNALQNNQGNANIAIGDSALYNEPINNNSVAIGALAGPKVSGASNIIIGYNAMSEVEDANDNIVIGSLTCAGSLTSGNNIIIGNRADNADHKNVLMLGISAIASADNQIVLGSATSSFGPLTPEVVVSDNTLTILLNGELYKILLRKV